MPWQRSFEPCNVVKVQNLLGWSARSFATELLDSALS
jgi:hypothetical protein